MAMHSSVLREALHRSDLVRVNDMRRHRRVVVKLSGRFMRADRSEYACSVKDISAGGAALLTPAQPIVGERIVAYLDHVGGLEGTAVRTFAGGFAFAFKVTEHKREKLTAQIMWLMNRDDYPDEVGRMHERVGTRGRRTTLKVEEGVVIDVELLDLSASGASLATPARPPIGSFVLAGRSRAIVRRHHEAGVGIQFLSVHTTDALRESFP